MQRVMLETIFLSSFHYLKVDVVIKSTIEFEMDHY